MTIIYKGDEYYFKEEILEIIGIIGIKDTTFKQWLRNDMFPLASKLPALSIWNKSIVEEYFESDEYKNIILKFYTKKT